MAATDKGVWDLQEVRDKQLASEWDYIASSDPGSLYIWGFAEYGALGNNTGSNNHKSSPVQIGTEATWTALTINNTSSGIKNDGTVWTWGLGQNGQLGINIAGPNAKRSSPTQIPGTYGSIVSSIYHSVLVKTNGTMWTAGRNQMGQLGQNTGGYNVGRRSSPVQIPGTWNPTQGATYLTTANNDGGTIHVKTDGSMWVWGQTSNGQLPLVDKQSRSSPTQVGTDTDWGYGEGKLGGNGDNSTFNIKTDGTLWAWGNNDGGTLGVPGVSQSSPIQVGTDTNWAWVPPNGGFSEYNNMMAAIKTDGTLWTWGWKKNGGLGHNEHGGPSGDQDPYSSPKQVGTDTTWKTVAVGHYACYATKTDNTFWVWGQSSYIGKLGDNKRINRSSPTQLPGTDWKRGSGGQYNGGGLKFAP
jgi:hypothetical protein